MKSFFKSQVKKALQQLPTLESLVTRTRLGDERLSGKALSSSKKSAAGPAELPTASPHAGRRNESVLPTVAAE